MAFYEYRRYVIRPGKMAEWIKLFETEILPFQVARGMVVCGVFRDEEKPEELFYWVRRFENEAERERLYDAVYKDPEWTGDISPRVAELMDREKMQVTRLSPSAASVLQ